MHSYTLGLLSYTLGLGVRREREVRFEGRETSVGRATDGIAQVGVPLRDLARLVCIDH